MMDLSSMAPEVEYDLDLDTYLEADASGRPVALTLEQPFEIKTRQNGKPIDLTVTRLLFHRPQAGDLDELSRMTTVNAFKVMRAFVARVTTYEDAESVPVDEATLAKRLDAMDFYRAWEAASHFLPKPKPRGAPSSDPSAD